MRMKKQQSLFRFPEYDHQNLLYYWMVSLEEDHTKICELHLGDTSKRVCTFALPKFQNKKIDSFRDYAEGLARVSYDCFKETQNVQNMRVVLPQNISYRFELGEFTNNFCPDKKVVIVLPENMKLFQVISDSRHWLLAADLDLEKFSGKEGYLIEPFDPKIIKQNFGYSLCVDDDEKSRTQEPENE